jgi:hypothetical protein
MLPVIPTLRRHLRIVGHTLLLICQLVFGGTLYWTVLLPLRFIPGLAFLLGITVLSAMTRSRRYRHW